MTVDVYDRVGDRPVFRLHKCHPASRNFRVDARSICATGSQWEATRFEEL